MDTKRTEFNIQRLTPSLFLLFLFLGPGCASFHSLGLPSGGTHFAAVPVEIPYRDFAGIVHVHSRYSHDSKGSFDEIVRAAGRARADFVVVTDHNTLQGLHEKMEGYYGQVLVLIGTELSTRAGHLIVLGVEKELDREQDPGEILKKAESEGGLGFIAHGVSKRSPWSDWSVAPLSGMEVYNLSSDVYEDGRFWVAWKFLFLTPRLFFRSVFDRPTHYLEQWDKLLGARRMAGIGAVDAHQKVRILGRAVDDYDTMFRVAQTHAWARDLSKESILEAFRKGRLYVGFDLVRPVRNFLFLARRGGRRAMMGDTVDQGADLKLEVFLPARGRIRLMKDGLLLKEKEGDYLGTRASGPGTYRVEVYRKRRIWILSNPIYVK